MADGVRDLALQLKLRRGVAVILGAVDSGKTTLARRLVRELLKAGVDVSLVDADIGQSSLGPPGTISVKTFRRPEDLEDPVPDGMIFTGLRSPAGDVPGVVEGTRRMAERASAGVVLVDTSGLVSGPAGRALKLKKIRVLGASHVIALERDGELEHIVGNIQGPEIHRLPVSPRACRRTRAERVRYREERFRAYFESARTLVLSTEEVEFLRRGKPFDIHSATIPAGSCMGLNRKGETLALGLLVAVRGKEVVVRTPLRSARGVDSVVVEAEPLMGFGA